MARLGTTIYASDQRKNQPRKREPIPQGVRFDVFRRDGSLTSDQISECSLYSTREAWIAQWAKESGYENYGEAA